MKNSVEVETGEWLTVKQAAARLGLTRSRVSQLLNAGRIQGARRYGGYMWMIPIPVVVLVKPKVQRVV